MHVSRASTLKASLEGAVDRETFVDIVLQQFGASIEMLENAIVSCSDQLWSDRSRSPQYWFLAYHTLFFIDLYSSETAKGFAPPAPFLASGMHTDIDKHERPYMKEELQKYLEHCRKKTRSKLKSLTDIEMLQPSPFAWVGVNNTELFIYNLRHMQHHIGQMNYILRQELGIGSSWLFKAKR
jgi:hypothetical protein